MLRAIFYNNPDTYPPIVNGSRLLGQAGYAVALTCRENGETWNVAYPPAVEVQRLDMRGGGSWKEYFRFVRATWCLEKEARPKGAGADMFIGHDMHGFLIARLLAWRYHKPLIYHCHDYVSDADAPGIATRGVRWVRAFEQRFARTADVVVVPDAERGEIIRLELRLPRSPLIVANAPLCRRTPEGGALRAALAARGVHGGRIVFRQGKISLGHAVEATLRSLPLWSATDAYFVLMGPGEPSYLERLRGLAHELGIAKRFIILPAVGYDRVKEFTPDADIGHALYEPLHVNNAFIATASNKIMEYMAAGLPLLVSDTASLRRLVETHHCGVTADEATPASIAAAVNNLLKNPAQTVQMRQAARMAFEDVFCYEKQYAPLFQRMGLLL